MRGIGFTVQTTEPQSPSCSTTHTQLLACVVFVHVLYIWVQGVGGGRGGGCSQDPFYCLQEVQAGMRVCTSRKCNLNNVYDANFKKKSLEGVAGGGLSEHTHMHMGLILFLCKGHECQSTVSSGVQGGTAEGCR